MTSRDLSSRYSVAMCVLETIIDDCRSFLSDDDISCLENDLNDVDSDWCISWREYYREHLNELL